jgi:hypothetical protein
VAKVTVGADQAVLGQFPPVCVRTGHRADGRVVIESRVGGPSAWAGLLVLTGPIGWIILFGLVLAVRGEAFSVRVPFSRAAWNAIMRATVLGRVLVGVGVLGAVTVALTSPSMIGGVLAVGAIVVGVVTVCVAKSMLPRVSLDATRRWITLGGVDPAFRAAVRGGQPSLSV